MGQKGGGRAGQKKMQECVSVELSVRGTWDVPEEVVHPRDVDTNQPHDAGEPCLFRVMHSLEERKAAEMAGEGYAADAGVESPAY